MLCTGLFLHEYIWRLDGGDCDVDTWHLKWWSSGQCAWLSGCFYLGTPVLCHVLNVCSHLSISFHTFVHFLDNLKISLIWRSTIVGNFFFHLIFKKVSVPFGLLHNGWREWPAYWVLSLHQMSFKFDFCLKLERNLCSFIFYTVFPEDNRKVESYTQTFCYLFSSLPIVFTFTYKWIMSNHCRKELLIIKHIAIKFHF